ncbi:hypothetical protein SeMB42_g07463, partial [Synchytrium endobioticum]
MHIRNPSDTMRHEEEDGTSVVEGELSPVSKASIHRTTCSDRIDAIEHVHDQNFSMFGRHQVPFGDDLKRDVFDLERSSVPPPPSPTPVSTLKSIQSTKGAVPDEEKDFRMDEDQHHGYTPLGDDQLQDVRNVVPTTDDPTLPCLTFRFWVLSTLFVVFGAAVGQFYFFRSATISLSLFFVILTSYPLGVGLSKIMPRPPPFPPSSDSSFMTKFRYWLNPGPFNVKEHTLLVVTASCGISVAYAIDVISVQILYYKQDIGILASVLLLWTTQCLGYGLAGLLRNWLVYPADMVWWSALPYVQLMSTFHGGQASPNLTRQRLSFFKRALLLVTLYQFIPGFLAPTLNSVALLCLLGGGPSQNIDPLLAQVGSGFNGAGVLAFSFDWNYIGSLGPLITPFWSMLNVIGSTVVFAWIIMPIFYKFTNIWRSQDFVNKGLAFSTLTFDQNLDLYNITRILDPRTNTLVESAYESYSPLYLSPFWAIGYGTAFAALSATLVHVLLFHGKDIVARFNVRNKSESPGSKGEKNDDPYGDDIHMRLMRRYPEVPSWVYMAVFIGMTALSIFIVEFWNLHLQLRWWGVLLAVALAGVFVLPVGIIQAISNQSIGINVVTEFVIGFISPGQPIANILFKTYGYMALSQALNLVSDLKLGVYMKIPPRAMFVGQVYGTMIGAVVNYAIMKMLLISVPDIQRKADGLHVGDEQWNPRYSSIFYAASV